MLAALARVPPRALRAHPIVAPGTLLRWHRALAAATGAPAEAAGAPADAGTTWSL